VFFIEERARKDFRVRNEDTQTILKEDCWEMLTEFILLGFRSEKIFFDLSSKNQFNFFGNCIKYRC
jgi:hypothetical protein